MPDVTSVVIGLGIVLIVALSVGRSLRNRSVKQYGPGDLAARYGRDPSLVLLDVRTSGERASHHIKGSVHIPLGELKSRVRELEPHRSKEIVCYCQSGSRSAAAAVMLKGLGFSVANLKGGITSWNYHHL